MGWRRLYESCWCSGIQMVNMQVLYIASSVPVSSSFWEKGPIGVLCNNHIHDLTIIWTLDTPASGQMPRGRAKPPAWAPPADPTMGNDVIHCGRRQETFSKVWWELCGFSMIRTPLPKGFDLMLHLIEVFVV